MMATGIAVLATLVVGVPAYWISHTYLTPDVEGWSVAVINGAVGLGVPGFVLLTLARVVGNAYVAARRNGWIDELARTHGTSADSLHELTAAVTSR